MVLIVVSEVVVRVVVVGCRKEELKVTKMGLK